MPCAGDESLRKRIPDGRERRELPLERRFGADVVTRSNSPSRFRNSRSFKVSKPRRQYAHECVEERIPVALCQQRFELLGKLNARIAGLNDGSFVMDDQETPRVEAL